MNSKPIKSYLNLTRILNYYLDWLKEDEQKNNPPNVEKILRSDLVKVLLGLLWIDKTIEDLWEFQANKYFMDSIGIEKLPTLEKFNSFSNENELKNLHSLATENKGINNYENLKILSIIILKKFNANISLIKAPNKQWSLDQKNYFEEHGYIVIHDVMNPSECDNYREIALNIAKDEKENNEGFFYGFENKFQRVYNLVNKSIDLGQLVTLPIVSEIMNDIFDRNTFHEKYLLSSYHLNIVPPKGEEQKLHLDSTVPDPLPPWLIRANMSLIIEDHNEKNGALLCLPGSHKFFRKPLLTDEAIYKKKLIKLVAPKGSIVLWSGHLWHKTSENKTNNKRTALLACFVASHLLEVGMEENHALIVDNENLNYFSDDLKRLLMFNHGVKRGAMMKSKHFKSKKNNK